MLSGYKQIPNGLFFVYYLPVTFVSVLFHFHKSSVPGSFLYVRPTTEKPEYSKMF